MASPGRVGAGRSHPACGRLRRRWLGAKVIGAGHPSSVARVGPMGIRMTEPPMGAPGGAARTAPIPSVALRRDPYGWIRFSGDHAQCTPRPSSRREKSSRDRQSTREYARGPGGGTGPGSGWEHRLAADLDRVHRAGISDGGPPRRSRGSGREPRGERPRALPSCAPDKAIQARRSHWVPRPSDRLPAQGSGGKGVPA